MALVSTFELEKHFICLADDEKTNCVNSLQSIFNQFDSEIDASPLNSNILKASTNYRRWSHVSLLFCRARPLVLTWPQIGNREKQRELFFFRISSGNYRVVCQGASYNFDSSDQLALLSNYSSLKLILDQPASLTLMSVSRELLPNTTYDFDKRPFSKIESQNPAIHLLTTYQEFLRDKLTNPYPSLTQKVGLHLIDLMTASLTSTICQHSAAQKGGSESWIEIIKNDIRANLGQIRLSAKTAARRHGVTDRYIHKLFKETGQTFGQYVTEQRLKRAYKLLTTPNYTVPISTIALEVGFGELSTFNRAFKRRFGETPSGIRRLQSAGQGMIVGQRKHQRHQNCSTQSSACR